MRRMAKRVLIYILGLLILAIGINISKAAQLGISPVSAVPYAIEHMGNRTGQSQYNCIYYFNGFTDNTFKKRL